MTADPRVADYGAMLEGLSRPRPSRARIGLARRTDRGLGLGAASDAGGRGVGKRKEVRGRILPDHEHDDRDRPFLVGLADDDLVRGRVGKGR